MCDCVELERIDELFVVDKAELSPSRFARAVLFGAGLSDWQHGRVSALVGGRQNRQQRHRGDRPGPYDSTRQA